MRRRKTGGAKVGTKQAQKLFWQTEPAFFEKKGLKNESASHHAESWQP
jgi:hypothetical protein